jgi:hypothetical protein
LWNPEFLSRVTSRHQKKIIVLIKIKDTKKYILLNFLKKINVENTKFITLKLKKIGQGLGLTK